METEYCPDCGEKTNRFQLVDFKTMRVLKVRAVCVRCKKGKYGGIFGSFHHIDDVETLRTTALKMERKKEK